MSRLPIILLFVTFLASGCATTTEPDGGPTDTGGTDSGSDTSVVDSGGSDTAPTDSGGGDTAPTDTGVSDTGGMDAADAGPGDTGPADTGPADTGPGDTGPGDTGPADTGPADTGTPPVFLTPGYDCGDFVLVDIVNTGAIPGDYTFTAAGPMGPTVTAARGGTDVGTASYVWTTTIGAVGSGLEYTFSFAGLFDVTVAKSGSGTRNLFDIGACLFDGVKLWRETGTPYVLGATYGAFVLVSITDLGAPAGIYTFESAGPMGPTVDLRRDGSIVNTQSYAWTTTIGSVGSGLEYTFTFPGYFDVVVAKAGSGTRNLFEVNVDLLDGVKIWTVP